MKEPDADAGASHVQREMTFATIFRVNAGNPFQVNAGHTDSTSGTHHLTTVTVTDREKQPASQPERDVPRGGTCPVQDRIMHGIITEPSMIKVICAEKLIFSTGFLDISM